MSVAEAKAGGADLPGEPAGAWTLEREVRALIALIRCGDPEVSVRAAKVFRDLWRRCEERTGRLPLEGDSRRPRRAGAAP